MGDRLSQPPGDARRLALDALAARDTPELALALAADALGAARHERDHEARAIAQRATALARLAVGDVPAARAAIDRSITAAQRCPSTDVLAGCLTTAGGIALIQGNGRRALELLDRACTFASDATLVDARAQRAWIRHRAGMGTAALAEMDELLSDGADPAPTSVQRAEILNDRAALLAGLGRHRDAEADFRAAAALQRAAGDDAAAFWTERNLGMCLVQAARLPEALRLFRALHRRAGDDVDRQVWLSFGQIEALLAANLVTEAVEQAERLLEIARPPLLANVRGEAYRLASNAHAANQDHLRAARHAREAARLYNRRGFEAFALVAERRATSLLPDRRRITVLGPIIERLRAGGLRGEEVSARVARLDAAARVGRFDVVADERRALAALRTDGPVLSRVEAWYGEARARAAAGEDGAASRAVARGLSLLAAHRTTLGATELRANVAGLGESLAGVGLDLAVRSGRPGAVWEAVERWRAGATAQRAAATPELSEALAELRAVQARHAEVLAGELDPAEYERRRGRAEDRVRWTARVADGTHGSAEPPASLAEVRAGLGERVMIEIVEHDGSYLAVVVQPGRRSRLVGLGRRDGVASAQADLAFALRRLCRAGLNPRAATAAVASGRSALDRLSHLLVEPLCLPASSTAVVVPPASLHTVPFGALPGLADRPVEIAPSAQWWHRAGSSHERGGPVALVAGPRLTGAVDEVERISRTWPGALVLSGAAATCAEAVRGAHGAGLVHLACHGHLRGDHPLLSSFELADGSLTVYDIEQLGAPPRRIVLAACDSAVGAARPGDELLGFVSALLAIGTREVVAAVVPVPDLATADLMSGLHAALAGSAGLAGALRTAADGLDPDDPAAFAARSAFVAFGRAAEPA